MKKKGTRPILLFFSRFEIDISASTPACVTHTVHSHEGVRASVGPQQASNGGCVRLGARWGEVGRTLSPRHRCRKLDCAHGGSSGNGGRLKDARLTPCWERLAQLCTTCHALHPCCTQRRPAITPRRHSSPSPPHSCRVCSTRESLQPVTGRQVCGGVAGDGGVCHGARVSDGMQMHAHTHTNIKGSRQAAQDAA